MQSSTVVTSMPVQGGGQMVVPIRNSMNVPTTRALAITQIVIGILSFVFGIGAATGFDRGFFVNKTGPGIWGGIWIFVTGVIGVISTTRPKSSPLNGTHMAFCIVSVMVAFINGVMFAIGLSFYNECQGRKSSYFINDYQYCSENRNSGVAVYACLVLMMIVEFFVALVTVVYTCQSADACCSSSGQGVVVQQQQPQYFVTSSSNQAYIAPSQFNAYPEPAVIPNTRASHHDENRHRHRHYPRDPPPPY